jgi:hypothetical protein
MIATLPINAAVNGVGAIVNRSTDGGLTWGNPVVVSSQVGSDKEWIVCDDTATSPFYGHCYVEWDDNAVGNVIQMSTSTDGGLTWSPAAATANVATGIGGQPVVQPNGTVVVPIDDAGEAAVLAFTSTNGGASWGSPVLVASIVNRTDPANLRSGPLPSAEIDGAGKVFVVWEDCRFEAGCASNDIVLSTSTDGTTWSSVQRIPIYAVGSGIDRFLPGLAVDRTTSGSSAHLVLTYYFYPNTACTIATCILAVGSVSSTDGGSTWSTPTVLPGAMRVTWLANTTQGFMVGDYISTSISGGKGYPVYALAALPSGGTFSENMFTVAGGLNLAAGTVPMRNDPVLSATSDHAASTTPRTAH